MKFFVLINPNPKQSEYVTDFISVEAAHVGDAPVCIACGQPIGPMPWLPPYRAEIEIWGKEFGDIAFGAGDDLMVTERFAETFRSRGLVGLLGFEQVNVARVIRKTRSHFSAPAYVLVNVVYGKAAIDVEASALVTSDAIKCKECRLDGIIRSVNRVIIEANTWQGEDIFVARGLPGVFIVSNRFVQFCDEEGITNAVFIPANEYSFDHYPRSSS